ncbi:MAG: hypothetical protein JW744_00105 [Candidatus Diapherotrites archaeon]|uniref:Ion transport domain-containing protein n=1 Tax=Candidatus Iainarchaeum sp. TaxID=3101447 RepID=A0A938YWY3_9ARCH|nr:hypothetical protein [Candidatus Diapherotrites archaeon]
MNRLFVRFWKALALVAVLAILITLILEFTVPLTEGQIFLFELIDLASIFILVVELLIRYIETKDKRHFFKNNLILLVSFFPFGSFFRVLRALKVIQKTIGKWFSKGVHLLAHSAKLMRVYRVIAVYFSKFREKFGKKKK